MHKVSRDEQDLPCNAYCVGDIHADLAYHWRQMKRLTNEALRQHIQQVADARYAAQDKCFAVPIEVLSVVPTPEAPPVDVRYPNSTTSEDHRAYLVRYRLRGATDGPQGGG